MSIQKSLPTLLLLGAVTLLSACGSNEQQVQQQIQLPAVTAAKVINERLTEWDEFTGRIQAPQSVELRPRVSGYIDFVAFEEGSIVKPGDQLFVIDNSSFKAEVKRLKANLLDAKSRMNLAVREYLRAQSLVKKNAISEELLDNRFARQQQAKANVQSVSAVLELAILDLSYTTVTAPIGGRVSNALITKGNYVAAGQSILTTIVSTNEVYAYFDADEQTYLKYTKLAFQGKRPSSRDKRNPVFMGLASDRTFPYEGVIDFVDNRVNETTGTIRGRAVFDNKSGSLIPGLFARIKLVGSASYQGILIDDKAIGTDLNNKYVLVVDQNSAVQYRAVELGEKLNGLRIIKSGLSADEIVVINGLQRVRPGTQAVIKLVEMTDKKNLLSLRNKQLRLDQAATKEQLVNIHIQSKKTVLPTVNVGA
jgi:multidrug efflux system membrane fusion protein